MEGRRPGESGGARGPPTGPPLLMNMAQGPAAAPGKVLVVDDTPLNRVVLGSMLRRAGLDVVEAANGAEALEKVLTCLRRL